MDLALGHLGRTGIRSVRAEEYVTDGLLAGSRRGELREVPEHAKERGELEDGAYV